MFSKASAAAKLRKSSLVFSAYWSAGCWLWAASCSLCAGRGWLSLGHGCLEGAGGLPLVTSARSARAGRCGQGGCREPPHGHCVGDEERLSHTSCEARQALLDPAAEGTDGLSARLLPASPWTSRARVAPPWPGAGSSPGPGWCWQVPAPPAVPSSAASAGRERGWGVRGDRRAWGQGSTRGRRGGSSLHISRSVLL